jgi:hypothetical protein
MTQESLDSGTAFASAAAPRPSGGRGRGGRLSQSGGRDKRRGQPPQLANLPPAAPQPSPPSPTAGSDEAAVKMKVPFPPKPTAEPTLARCDEPTAFAAAASASAKENGRLLEGSDAELQMRLATLDAQSALIEKARRLSGSADRGKCSAALKPTAAGNCQPSRFARAAVGSRQADQRPTLRECGKAAAGVTRG